jgi:hypothetical protein
MGGRKGIANPLPKLCKNRANGSSAPLAEQGVGSGAVRGGFAAVGGNAGDFGFEQGDAFIQLGLRIGAKVLGSEACRGVSDRPGAIGFFHCFAASAPSGLLSIGETVIRRSIFG